MNLNTLINNNKKQFDKKFKDLLNNSLDKSILSKAMFYGCNNGGKRIRPFLVNQASKISNVNINDAFIISASIESIHSYSLIHDDLPSMDNDDYRRGKLSTHKKFNEATAILAGDALHDLAFELGCDIPFFINGGIQISEGKGEKLTKLDLDLTEYFMFIFERVATLN